MRTLDEILMLLENTLNLKAPENDSYSIVVDMGYIRDINRHIRILKKRAENK